MHKHGLCCRPVSVHLSITLLYCIQTAEDIIRLLSWANSSIILVFDPSADAQFPGNPSSRGSKIYGVQNFAIFD